MPLLIGVMKKTWLMIYFLDQEMDNHPGCYCSLCSVSWGLLDQPTCGMMPIVSIAVKSVKSHEHETSLNLHEIFDDIVAEHNVQAHLILMHTQSRLSKSKFTTACWHSKPSSVVNKPGYLKDSCRLAVWNFCQSMKHQQIAKKFGRPGYLLGLCQPLLDHSTNIM